MIKNIMGAAIAVALAVGIGTTGVISNTTYKKPTQIIAAAKTTTYDFSNIVSVSGKNAALESCLTSAYGFSVSNRSNMNETFKLSSENGADLNIYVLNRTYDYQLWETDLSHDISSDSYLGNGTIKRPVGLIITVSKNS